MQQQVWKQRWCQMSRSDSPIWDFKGKKYRAVGTHSWRGCPVYPGTQVSRYPGQPGSTQKSELWIVSQSLLKAAGSEPAVFWMSDQRITICCWRESVFATNLNRSWETLRCYVYITPKSWQCCWVFCKSYMLPPWRKAANFTFSSRQGHLCFKRI